MSSLLDKKQTGIVFSVQKYSVHDGPGIRTLVFLKGCPLRCAWCSNPESQSFKPELAYNRNKCLGIDKCTRCVDHCSSGAITFGEDDKIDLDHDLAKNELHLAKTCPNDAIIVYGEEQTVDKVLKRVEEDEMFYARSGGGMTISGGEPFAQPEFALPLLREARRRHINTAVETCGAAKWETIEECMPYINTLMFDIKSMNKEKHKKFTGHSNEAIIENLKKIREHFPKTKIRVRTPIIPGFNDSEEDIAEIIKFISELPGEKCEYEALEYHRMGQPKYENLGREYPLDAATMLDGEVFTKIKTLVDRYNKF
ncbi:glycyl-radical enzyme activating protein [Maridesulfovibrio sp.]|uniref:(2S)-3-sulfopropanediol dehydratase activating enzyme n=1 Tax=Maridesulfovibrio sp. TaxID=2795000 RepID=UPI0029F45C42|nr:glycyl-radical enzyme activating protein [Maridesulfovibrio sp.]